MFDKHAVWVQCATTFHIALSWAAATSYQNITFDMDIYWSFFFAIQSFILMSAAEHDNILNISVEKWLTLERFRNISIVSTFILWYGSTLSIYSYTAFSMFTTTVLFYIPDYVYYVATIFWLFIHSPYSIGIVSVIWGMSRWLSKKSFQKILQKSTASPLMKEAYGFKSIYIVAEAIILWHIRCMHRFPYQFRWQPVCISAISIPIAMLYCHFNVKKTTVSRNCIIVSSGHGMAASLTAAQKCPVCKKCLTSLDMESSFNDGF